MRTIVTGGSGFIGSNIVDGLLARGDEVTVLDDLSTGRRENLDGALAKGAELVEGDIRDQAALVELAERVRPEGTINVLTAAQAVGARVVNSSTGGAIYGEGKIIPAPEDHPVAPEAPYGQSKFAAEGYCGLFNRLHGVSAVSLRYGNVYGPRQDPLGEAGVIAIFCGKLLEGEQPMIFGDGLQTRDYVFVGDVVRANLAAADSDATGAINIGTGVQSSVIDLVEALAPQADGRFEAIMAPERPGEVRHIALDATRAGELLGWSAEMGLADGLAVTLDSLR
jgi:UDP-glucose 4-epimerase